MSVETSEERAQPTLAPESDPAPVSSPVAAAALESTPEPVAAVDEPDPELDRWKPKDVSTPSERKYQTRVRVLTKDGRAFITATFIVPAHHPSVLHDLCLTAGKSTLSACAAAIGVCWFGKGRPEAARKEYVDGLSYGREVADELLRDGLMPTVQLYVLGGFLLGKCADLLTEESEDVSGFFD